MTMTIDDMYLTVSISITKKSDICITVTYHAMFLTTQLWPQANWVPCWSYLLLTVQVHTTTLQVLHNRDQLGPIPPMASPDCTVHI